LVTTATTLSLVALTMMSIQEASAAECNSNDNTKNNNNDDSKTCANQLPQEHSKNHDTKNSIPFRLPMPFP